MISKSLINLALQKKTSWALLSILLGAVLIETACTKTVFSSDTRLAKGGSSQAQAGSGDPAGSSNSENGGLELKPTFSITEPLKTAQTENSAWVVTSDGYGYKISLDAAKGYPVVNFKGLGAQGHRTFVSKYGLFVGTTAGVDGGGKIYFVPQEVTEGSNAVVAVDLNALGSGDPVSAPSRVCVIVYTVNNTDYLGAAYQTASGSRKFYRVPIDPSKPNHVDASKQQVLNVASGDNTGWGYSCAYDPKRNYFYSKNSGKLVGVDLTSPGPNMVVVNPPNGNHVMMAEAFSFQPSTSSGGSYAVAIGTDGSILNDSTSGSYTMAHEPVSKNVIISKSGALYVADEQCFTQLANCADPNKTSVFTVTTTPEMKPIGPLSSLNDGRVLGLNRGGNESGLYMISLKDPQDRRQGLKVVKIKDIKADPYMYTDFTGSMTTAAASSLVIDLTKAAGFKPEKPIQGARLKWREEPGAPTNWMGLTLAVACMKKGDANTQSEPIELVPNAGVDIDLSKVKGCTGVYDQVRIDVKPSTTGVLVFSKTSDVQYAGFQ